MQLNLELWIAAGLLTDAARFLLDECRDIRRPCTPVINDEVWGMRRDLRVAERVAFHACQLDQATGIVSGRILEDQASVELLWLCALAVEKMLAKNLLKFRGIFVVQVDAEQQNDLGWLDHRAWCRNQMAVSIEAGAALFAEAAMSVAQIELVMLIAAYLWQVYIIPTVVATPTRVQHLNPRQRLPQFSIVRARIANHATAQRTGNAHAKLQSAPTLRRKFV